jgi:glutamate-ammonia-ligase adenylyltransferase
LDSIILRADAEIPRDPALADQAFEALAERRLVGELLALLDFAANNNLENYLQKLTSLADQIATDAMLTCANEMGIEPLGLIALGKWGGREFGAKSDLDFVFLVRGSPQAAQQKLARRFIHRLTESRRGGQLYSIDLRLRPSGHAGPILVEHDQLHQHLLTQAEAWERQSWLRARLLAEEQLRVKLDFSPSKICRSRPWTIADHEQVLSISRQLFKPIDANAFDLDLKLVRGGLASVEFAAQIDCLRLHEASEQFELEPSTQSMIHFLERTSSVWSTHSARLLDIYRRTRLVEQWHRLTGDVSNSKINFRAQETDRVARRLGLREEDHRSTAGVRDDRSSLNMRTRLKSFLIDGLRESESRLAAIEAERK